MSTLFVELISILVNANMYFNYFNITILTLFFYISIQYDCKTFERLENHRNLQQKLCTDVQK